MAYGTKYTLTWSTRALGKVRIEIEQEGYSSGVTALTPGEEPLRIEWGRQERPDLSEPVLESTAFLQFIGDTDGQKLEEVFDSGDTEYRVTFRDLPGSPAPILWQGYLVTDEWRDNPDLPAETVELEATGGLKLLQTGSIVAPGGPLGVWATLKNSLHAIHDLPTQVGMEWYPYRDGAQIAADTQPLGLLSVPETWAYEELTERGTIPVDGTRISPRVALEDLAERFRMTVMQSKGRWRVRQRDRIDAAGSVKVWDWDEANSTFATPRQEDLTTTPLPLAEREKPRSRVGRLRQAASTYDFGSIGNFIGNPGFETGDKTNWESVSPTYEITEIDINSTAVLVEEHSEEGTAGADSGRAPTQEDQYVVRIAVPPTSDGTNDAIIDDFPEIAQKLGAIPDAGPRGAIEIGFEYTESQSNAVGPPFVQAEIGGYYLRKGELNVRADADAADSDEGFLPIDDPATAVSTSPPQDGVVVIPEGATLKIRGGQFNDTDTEITTSLPVRIGDTGIRGKIDAAVTSGAKVQFWYWEDSPAKLFESQTQSTSAVFSGFQEKHDFQELPDLTENTLIASQRTPDGEAVAGDATLRLSVRVTPTQDFNDVFYDNTSLRLQQAGEETDRARYIAADDGLGRSLEMQHRTGDGPGLDHPRGLILDGIDGPTGDWQRGAYASGDPPSGKSLEEVTAEVTMSEQRETLERRTYTAQLTQGASLWPHHVVSLDGTMYGISYLSRTFSNSGEAVVELSELKAAGTSGLDRDFQILSEDSSGGTTGGSTGGTTGGGTSAETWANLAGKPSGLFSSNGDGDGFAETQALGKADIADSLSHSPGLADGIQTSIRSSPTDKALATESAVQSYVDSNTAAAGELDGDGLKASDGLLNVKPSDFAGTGLTDTNDDLGIADAGVDGAQLASGAVTRAKIGDAAVGTTQIGANAVTQSKVADGQTFPIDIFGNADTVDGYDGSELAALAENERVTGKYEFTAEHKFEFGPPSGISSNIGIVLRDSNGNQAEVITREAGSDVVFMGNVFGGNSADTQLRAGNSNVMRLTEGGNVGIGTTNPSYALEVSGDARSTGEVEAFLGSDRRLKTDLDPLNSALDKVDQLTGYGFDWHEGDAVQPHKRGKPDVGLIAQEVEDVLPEAVKTFSGGHSEGYKSVSYDKLVPLLVEAIKDLRSQVQTLQ